MTPEVPLLELSGITKAFPGVIANNNIDLSIQQGEIHALLGENGAGKSTLVKMLYGLQKPDSGSITFCGDTLEIKDPAHARSLGIAMVFQHFSLFPALTVAQNIKLGLNSRKSVDDIAREVTQVSKHYGLQIYPNDYVYELSVGEQQRVEIIRCLLVEPRLLVMDEPTSVLTPQEVEVLFETLVSLAEGGVSILYISHKLEEIRTLCHRATVLRHGEVVAEVDPREHSAASLASIMLGEELAEAVRDAALDNASDDGEILLELNGLTDNPPGREAVVKDVDVFVRSGEIVGIAGVAGNGQVELLAAINGECPAQDNASIQIRGNACGLAGAVARRRLGLCSVPEERLGHSAVPYLSLNDNAYLTGNTRMDLGRFVINADKVHAFANRIIETFDVRCDGNTALAGSLSGGNLQKFIVGRELLQDPQVVVVSQPTWGVDAGAAALIHSALIDLAKRGCAILVISQDLDELFAITHRMGAICGGRVSQFYPTTSLDPQSVGILMGGASSLGDDADHSGVDNV